MLRSSLLALWLMFVGCAAAPYAKPTVDAAAYTAELDNCVEVSKTIVQYRDCANRVDRKFGKTP